MRFFHKFAGILLAVALLLTCTACAGQTAGTAGTAYTPLEIAQVIVGNWQQPVALAAIIPKDENFALHLENSYLISAGEVADGAICVLPGTRPSRRGNYAKELAIHD